MAAKLGLKVRDFGGLVGVLNAKVDASAEPGESKDGENNDDGEEFVFWVFETFAVAVFATVAGRCLWVLPERLDCFVG